MATFPILAIVAGLSIALQAVMNAKLGVLLKDSLLATLIAFLAALTVTTLFWLYWNKSTPNFSEFKQIPWYLWFSGGLSALGVGLFYFLIPKMGAGSMMTYVLGAQIVFAMIISHFGWLEMPKSPINLSKLFGLFAIASRNFFN
jgi:bacterial/archaeal transporter family-2 protein